MTAETVILRQTWVNITASSYGGMPEEIDHIQTRGAHPELALDPANLRGLTAMRHRARHAGIAVPEEVDLRAVWG